MRSGPADVTFDISATGLDSTSLHTELEVGSGQ